MHDTGTRTGRRSNGEVALDLIERIGNRLPNPVTLFALLAVGVLVASSVVSRLGLEVHHPRDGSVIVAVNLLDARGVRRVFTDAIKNFMGFAPLGSVLAAMIGIGVAEASGLIAVLLRGLVLAVPRRALTAAVVFTGLLAHVAADAGFVVLPPMAAMLFAAVGRHPIAGLAAAFAGVAGGFSANVLPTMLDVLLASFTQEAVNASKLVADYHVEVLGNWYFLAASAPMLTLVATVITERVVEPRLGPYEGPREVLRSLEPSERRGLAHAGLAACVTIALILALVLPSGAPLRIAAPTLLDQIRPFFDSMVVLVLILFFVPGVAYGISTKRIRSDHDVAKMIGDTLATMGTYIALAFAASQFVSYFAWSNLGAMVAISGAAALQRLGLSGGPLLASFVLFTALVNLFISSASAKWAMLAPIFVPMFLLLGFSPEATQVVFRIGDSSTNIVTPLLPYLPIVLSVVRRHQPEAGTGTIIALMAPYSVAFLISWTLLLLVFFALGWPLGPGVYFAL